MSDRKGFWFITYSGVKFWPLDPRPEEILIEDIAHALSQINRFTGHTKKPYSVAEHSLRISRACEEHDDRRVAIMGLLHDASETYLGDVASPLKSMDFMVSYRFYESQLQDVIYQRFGIDKRVRNQCSWISKEVHKLDRQFLLAEARDLVGADISEWGLWADGHRPRPETITPIECPRVAEMLFLSQFHYLRGEASDAVGDLL